MRTPTSEAKVGNADNTAKERQRVFSIDACGDVETLRQDTEIELQTSNFNFKTSLISALRCARMRALWRSKFRASLEVGCWNLELSDNRLLVASFAAYGIMLVSFLIMNKPKIIAYLKPTCGWSQGVRAIMRKYDLPYEDRDIINDPIQRQEMIEKSGQMLSPCVEVNGEMLPDISGEEVEAFLLSKGLVGQTDRAADAPTNQPCAHEMPQSAPLQFRR